MRKVIAFAMIIFTYPFLLIYYFIGGGLSGSGEFVINTHELIKSIWK